MDLKDELKLKFIEQKEIKKGIHIATQNIF